MRRLCFYTCKGCLLPGGCLLWGVCSWRGACSLLRGAPRGVPAWGVPAWGMPARRVPARGSGHPWKADSYCCGRYASYRNAFLFIQSINQVVYSNHIFLLSPGNEGGGSVSNGVCLLTGMKGMCPCTRSWITSVQEPSSRPIPMWALALAPQTC